MSRYPIAKAVCKMPSKVERDRRKERAEESRTIEGLLILEVLLEMRPSLELSKQIEWKK